MPLRYLKSYSISNASSDNSLIPDTPSSNPPSPPPHIQCRLGAEVCTVLGIKKNHHCLAEADVSKALENRILLRNITALLLLILHNASKRWKQSTRSKRQSVSSLKAHSLHLNLYIHELAKP